MRVTKLRELRIINNLKLKDFAQTTDLSIQAIYDIETGRRKPSYEVLIKILKFLGKPYHKEIEDLFEAFEKSNA